MFHPDLRARPVVVLSNNDGCVVLRNHEAKALGIMNGTPWFKIHAQQLFSVPSKHPSCTQYLISSILDSLNCVAACGFAIECHSFQYTAQSRVRQRHIALRGLD